MNTKVCETINMIQTQVHTQLIEVQVCPVQPSGTGRRQRTDKNLSVTVQSPESVPTCWQVGELHLKDTAESHTPVETITADTAQSVLVFFFTSGGRGTDEGRSSPSWSQTQNKSFLLWANHRNVPVHHREHQVTLMQSITEDWSQISALPSLLGTGDDVMKVHRVDDTVPLGTTFCQNVPKIKTTHQSDCGVLCSIP